MNLNDLRAEVERLPASPGVYIMKDAKAAILYIGKALNLRNRVRSYFLDEHADRPLIPIMLGRLHHIEWIATSTETEALILEANLIRSNKPPYNIDLKDDQHYPYLKVTLQERFPRLIVARRVLEDGARYFGPYTDARAMRRILSYAKRVFRIRDCSKDLPLARPARPCINYPMGRCSGACAGLIEERRYRESVDGLVQFLRGRRNELLAELKQRMHQASDQLRYEEAAQYRDQIRLIEEAGRLQSVDLKIPDADCDVFGVYEGDRTVCLAVLHFREGLLVSKRHFLVARERWQDQSTERDSVVLQFYMGSAQEYPREVLLSAAALDSAALEKWFATEAPSRVTVATPQKGAKKLLVEMAEKNARLYLAEKIPLDPGRDVEDLQLALCLPRPPAIIEAFDVSTLGGSFAVAGMVRFVNGTADKAGYRRYRIRTVEGQNDFGMLVEAATRRLARLEAEQKPPPDLLLIDGGKGQLNAVAAALSAVANPPMLASLAKEEEVLHSAYLPEPVRLDRTHPALKLAQRVRDEVHRWSVSYHRAIRGRQFRHSSIESVHGIGPKTALRLLKAFGSFQALKAASAEDIAKVKGVSAETALRLRDFLDRS